MSHVTCHLSPVTCRVTCHNSLVTWPPLYADPAAMKVPEGLASAARDLGIDIEKETNIYSIFLLFVSSLIIIRAI